MGPAYLFIRSLPNTCQFAAVLVDPVTRQTIVSIVRWSEEGAARAADAWARKRGYDLVDFRPSARKAV